MQLFSHLAHMWKKSCKSFAGAAWSLINVLDASWLTKPLQPTAHLCVKLEAILAATSNTHLNLDQTTSSWVVLWVMLCTRQFMTRKRNVWTKNISQSDSVYRSPMCHQWRIIWQNTSSKKHGLLWPCGSKKIPEAHSTSVSKQWGAGIRKLLLQ